MVGDCHTHIDYFTGWTTNLSGKNPQNRDGIIRQACMHHGNDGQDLSKKKYTCVQRGENATNEYNKKRAHTEVTIISDEEEDIPYYEQVDFGLPVHKKSKRHAAMDKYD